MQQPGEERKGRRGKGRMCRVVCIGRSEFVDLLMNMVERLLEMGGDTSYRDSAFRYDGRVDVAA